MLPLACYSHLIVLMAGPMGFHKECDTLESGWYIVFSEGSKVMIS